ncbi:MAG TPA: hypothetical protein ENK52_05280, partial [Saprospiraceae bacterium]|nr:hypothetical protein [Saprospiraceae bacterium]
MKNLKIIFLSLAFLASGLAISSCGSGEASGSDHTKTEKQGMEYTSAYVCPMHCEGSGSDKAGKCPKC